MNDDLFRKVMMDKIEHLFEEPVPYDRFIHRGWIGLHYACEMSSPESIAICLEAGSDINARTTCGSTPLNIVCQNSRSLDCLKLLLAAGADVDIPDCLGWTPLYTACNSLSFNEGIELLIEAGANVNAKSNQSQTPLHNACYLDNVNIVQLLLEAGADPSIKNDKGKLPQDLTEREDIITLIENSGLGGGVSTKEAR
jgi:ankyrin repeat protein